VPWEQDFSLGDTTSRFQRKPKVLSEVEGENTMQKIKLFIGLFVYLIIGLFMTRSASASVLSIQSLPSYINNNYFKLSCTSDGGSVQFSVSKNGGASTNFGPVIDTSVNPCIVQVDSSVENDQTTYIFSAGGFTTTTFYDISGPSPISGFYKERLSDGEYKLHWTNPSDTDFDKVVIYSATAQGFSADSSHEIARVSGGPSSNMTYDDFFAPDPSKTYFYLIRALDHAGNSSSLAGDGGSTTYIQVQVLGSSATPAAKKTTTTVVLPKEKVTGTILGTEVVPGATATPEITTQPVNTNPGIFKWVLTHKKISGGVALILLVIAYGLYRFSRKNK
jgi:hypothetical protein